MAPRLAGTTALVTGASSGIGEATALALAAEGARVGLVARRHDRLEALAARIADAGGDALVLAADITVREAATSVVARAARELGRLDVVVCNAGLMLIGPVEDAELDEWDRMIAVNVQGLMYVAHAALPHLLDAAAGAPRGVADLVSVSSVAGRRTGPGAAVYNATKFGVGAFSDALRQEVTERHVRVGLIEPGAVATELQGHNRPEVVERMRAEDADMEVLRPEDVADAIAYVVTRPRHVAVNELLVRPTEQP
ncbi:SDR family NAD(P)-dependent oxidoreductase [Patulibacter sp. S7RM1-6]